MRHQKYTETLDKPEITGELLRRIGSYLKPYKLLMLGAVMLILVASFLGLAPQLILQQIVDTALGQKNGKLLIQLVILSFSATFALNLISTLQSYINMTISKDITNDMKNEMYHHLQYMSVDFFGSEKSGEIMTRMTSDIDGVSDVFHQTIVTLLSGVFTLGTTLFALFTMNPTLALVAIATVPLFVLPTKYVGKKRWKITKERQEKNAVLNSHIQEALSISGAMLTKIFTMEQQEYGEFKHKNSEVISLQKKEQLTGRWYRMLLNMLSSIGPLLVYFVGGMLYIKGQITIGTILTFAGLLSRLYHPVMQLSSLHIDTVNSLALFQRIFQYLDKPQEVESRGRSQNYAVAGHAITFENVSFAYEEGERALKEVSFTLPKGKTTALVGPSGAGKTTITNLIPRFHQVTSGTIKIGDMNINDLDLRDLRSQIGIVTQEPYLFNGTIRENLLYGSGDKTDDEMIAAAKSAYIHDYITSLPKGYETIVGNRGVKLSGGEKQRISIARVILKDPAVIMMDEATSALDSVSESYIQQAMGPLLADRTAILIAHRLSTIQGADQILVIEDGKVSEQGKHEELLDDQGLYYDLYQKQFKDLKVAI